MRQIAEFVAVLACGLFTGAAVYISLVEHPRMECGVELAAAEFPPSYRRASIMQATLAAVGLLCPIAAWVAGATFWWVIVVEPDTGQAVSPNGSATRTLGHVAFGKKRAKRHGAAAVLVLGDL